MASGRKTLGLSTKTALNRRRRRPRFSEALRLAEARARVRANRPANRRRHKLVRASIASALPVEAAPHPLLRMMRWMLALCLLPLCAVTSVTFFGEFSTVTLDHAFWRTSAFWYFATGVVLMLGWFSSGLLWNVFLYLYVLGHELTHILFIHLFRGRVTEWGVSLDGGFVTTDKSNIIIALAPYFVPLWAAITVSGFALVGWFVDLSPVAVKTLYGLIGFFWAFHLVWTLWMIPRDQPDLRENGTFLSLMIIYLANIAVLVALTCLASPDMGFRAFASEWLDNARGARAGAEALWRDLARAGWR
jgi:hypothetical protein